MPDTDTEHEDVQPKPTPPADDGEPDGSDEPSGRVETPPSANAVPSDPIEGEDGSDDTEVSVSAHAAMRALKRHMIQPVDQEV